MTAPTSRLDSARRRLRVARYAIGAIAAGSFAGGIVAVRAAHPGGHARRDPVAVAETLAAPQSFRQAELDAQSSSGFGSSSIAPATSSDQPVVQSAGS